MNGICLSAVYQHLNFDEPSSAARSRNRCFLQRQMGYLFNHKCSTPGSSCNTPDNEGFSYLVGCGPPSGPGGFYTLLLTASGRASLTLGFG